jgi:hypothetical protein
MKFEKGNTYGSGRPKGSKNIATDKIRKAFTELLEKNMDKLQEDLDALDSKDRLKSIMDLASYVLPKLRNVEMQLEHVEQPLFPDIHKLMEIPEEDTKKELDEQSRED